MELQRYCKGCEAPFTTTNTRQLYCARRCLNATAKRRERQKARKGDYESYLEKQRKAHKKWRDQQKLLKRCIVCAAERNSDVNLCESCRRKKNNLQRKRYTERLFAGICVTCGKVPAIKEYITTQGKPYSRCNDCADKHLEWQKNYQSKNKEQHLKY